MLKKITIQQSVVAAMLFIVSIALLSTYLVFYILFSQTTTDVIRSSSREINKQVIMNYERYIDEMIATANYLTQKTVELSEKNEISNLEALFIQAKDMSQDIDVIILFDTRGQIIINSEQKPLLDQINQTSWFTKSITEKEIFHFSAPRSQNLFYESNIEVITMTKNVKFFDEGILKDGVLMIDLTTDNLRSLSQKTNLGIGGAIVILDESSNYVYSTTPECYGRSCSEIEIINEIILGGKSVKFNDHYMYVNVNTIKHTRWRIATFINIDSIYQTRNTMNLFATIIFIIAFLLSLGFSIYISNRISVPLNRLKKHMSHIEKGELFTTVVKEGQLEVVTLAHHFNQMIEKIKDLMERLVLEQKEKRKSEFFALQTQINPHFLYNTLDSIVWLAEKNKNDDVIEMVLALSRFFRISISRGKNVIPIKDEIDHVTQYLKIQKIRYNLKFDYKFDIDEIVYRYSIVKLVLQPIIENAIHHGITSDLETGFIQITSYVKAQHIFIDIQNNGYGITPEKIDYMYQLMKKEGESNSIGLRNVYQRLKIYYGDASDIIITSVLDEMTCITIKIPLREAYFYEKNI